MTTIKALVTRRGVGSGLPKSLGFNSREAEGSGVRVEEQTSGGTLVSGETSQLEQLENQGFRVKVLPNPDQLRIGDYVINTNANSEATPELPRAYKLSRQETKAWTHHLVQLVAPPTEEWVKAIEERGVDVVEPVSAYGLFVVGRPEQVNALRELSFVSWTGPFEPAYRISPELRTMKGHIQYVKVTAYPASAVAAVQAAVEAGNGVVVNQQEGQASYRDILVTLLIEIDAKQIPVLAQQPNVRWLEYQTPVFQSEDERSAMIIAERFNGAVAPNTAPVTGYQGNLTTLGLTGAGVTVGICDGGVDTNNAGTMHTDLAGRLSFFVDLTGGQALTDVGGHGTHVAGIAVGNGGTGDTDPQGFLLGQGVAPGANFGILNPVDNPGGPGTGSTSFQNFVQLMATNGANVMNNSYRMSATGYSLDAAMIDKLVRDPNPTTATLENLTIVFSAGNSGPANGTITAGKEAKNPIVVGNSLNFRPGEGDTDDIRGLLTSSSRGPAVDGRILPTIVAPGTDIISARSASTGRPVYNDTGGTTHNRHTQMSGTSMASPHVAGLSALLIEWWRQRTGQTPSPAMVKALLINGAIDMFGGPNGSGGTLAHIPNSQQGWGRVSLENVVVQAPASDRGPKVFSDQRHAFTANGQQFTIRVAPVDTARPMRVTLVWTDSPGAAGANPALMNDLDLEVINSVGTLFKGNVFANGFSISGGSADALNNVECVYLQNPSGVYEITVVASNLRANARPPFDAATPWQDFALVVDNAEYALANPVSVVPVIDRSASMDFYGYVNYTKSSSQQFIDLLTPGDQVGIVSFGSNVSIDYPTGGPGLQTIAGGSTEKTNAKNAIQALNFTGMTFMGGGIQAAASMLGGATGDRAMVLLSDGYDNRGGNPANPSALNALTTLPASLPVYTCAMGPASDQALLQQIATSTAGRYYYMPTIDDLHEIYNYIRGQITGDGIIVNEAAMASSSRVGGFVERGATELTFSVVWLNSKLRYTTSAPRQSNQIRVRLRDPRGQLLHSYSSYVQLTKGENTLVFKIQEPLPGQWYVEIETGGDAHTRYVVGGFVKSPLRFLYNVNLSTILAGAPLTINAQVLDSKRPVKGLVAKASILAPQASQATLLSQYKRQLTSVQPIRGLEADGIPKDQARLLTLNANLIKESKPGIFASVQSSPTLKRVELASSPTSFFLPGAGLSGKFNDTREAGSYNVVVEVSGTSEHSNTRFVRKNLVSVLVK